MMKINENDIFNLVDTNGRCNQLIDTYTVLLETLYEMTVGNKLHWRTLKNGCTTQFNYYKEIKRVLKDIYKKNDWYDLLFEEIKKNKALNNAINNGNINDYEKVKNVQITKTNKKGETKTKTISDIIDTDIESRSRHYTNSLVKIGFINNERYITDVGTSFLNITTIFNDDIEKLLPLNASNVIYLRQLLKLRIFDASGKKYYSPFIFALYVLLEKSRISNDEFREIIQGTSPYHCLSDLEVFIKNYQKNDVMKSYKYSVPEELDNNNMLSFDIFSNYFKNGKSDTAINVYYDFYKALYTFINKQDTASLVSLLSIYEGNKPMLNKAFGYGSNIFKNKKEKRPLVSDFLKNEKSDLFTGQLNSTFYLRFKRSKTIDKIREYSDTTIRIFKATGLISLDNGYVELVCSDLCKHIFDKEILKSHVFGDITNEEISNVSDYEETIDSYYCSNHSIVSILDYSDKDVDRMLHDVQSEFGGAKIADIPQIIKQRRKNEFDQFINNNYPETRVKALLGMFSDRSNDKKIKEEVCLDATVPTIYEYVVGLVWYYFSNKTIDLLSSFNLTLSANFEPLTHAGGGMGDIVIYGEKQVIMLEATLMNANSQKRGEWEPVLRHSVNLKIDEENSTNREVTTFFIADSFDFNTINIWKAISSVPLQSSTDKDKYTDSVIIMPINNDELSKLMDRKSEYNSIIQQVRKLFLKDITSFDKEWRDKFIKSVMI